MSRESYRLMLLFIMLLSMAITVSVAHANGDREDCPEFEKHKCAKNLKLNRTNAPLVCIRGEVKGPTKVTIHFKRADGSYLRPPIARTYSGSWHIKFARSTFEEVHRVGGKIKICAGERGEIGAVFEEHNIVEHLKNGEKCISETVCLFPGLTCPSDSR